MSEKDSASSPLIKFTVVLHVAALACVILKPGLWVWALSVAVLNHLFLTALGLWPRSTWLGPNWTRLPPAARARNEIAITIDDGPDPDVTPQVLDVLDQYQVKATFFCIGQTAQSHPGLCREIARRGHDIENHSQHHRHHFSLMGPRGMSREVEAAQTSLMALSGRRPLFFRAPAGLRNPFLQPVLARLDLRLASWTARGFDTRDRDEARVKSRLLDRVEAGAILLLHDGHAARTATGIPVILAVLPDLLDAIHKTGLTPVTLRAAAS